MNKKTHVIIWSALVLVTALSSACASAPTVKPTLTRARPDKGIGSTPISGLAQIDPIPWTLLKLPDTGQVKDYTSTSGEDSDYTINPPVYADNHDGTVIDQVTGLVWQQRDGGEMIFAGAITYCQKLDLAGHTDWRLPFSQELYSILDHDRKPALDPSIFPTTSAEYWWTASELAGDSTRAWVVNAGGGIGAHPKSETISAGGSKHTHARCVRNVPGKITNRFSANGTGVVADQYTALMWQQDEETRTLSWQAALTYCEDLTLDHRDDWRLPNIKELHSISDDTKIRPSIDMSYFPKAQAVRYWASTTLYGRTGSAWFVDLATGLTSYNDKTGQLSVRCVRGG